MRWALLCLMAVLFVGSCIGQQQTNFGSEEEVSIPVRPPGIFLSMLSRQDREQLKRCQSGRDMPSLRKDNALDQFAGSILDVRNRTNDLTLMIVQATSCLLGAHNTGFWVLAKKRRQPVGKYQKIFDIRGDWLEVKAHAAGLYPDIVSVSHTAIEYFEATYKYSRGRYRQSSCYVFANGEDPPTRRFRCSKYNWEFRK